VKSEPVFEITAFKQVAGTAVVSVGVATTEAKLPVPSHLFVVLANVTAGGTVIVSVLPAPLVHSLEKADFKLATPALKEASLALALALFRLTKTIDAKIPIIAITIKSSIRVNPFLFFIFHLPF
jgi:hypothetical protein